MSTISSIDQDNIVSIGWDISATKYKGRLDQDFIFKCPSRGTIGTIWGSNIYTTGSKICTAAVHAGKINTRDGGIVSIRIKSGENYYVGSKRNGISSLKYGSYPSSYSFL